EDVLLEHQRHALHLGDARGEVIVPEERHFLAKRKATVQQAVVPPAAQLERLISLLEALSQAQQEAFIRRLPRQQPIERGAEPLTRSLAQLGEVGSERSPTIEMAGPFEVPGMPAVRFPGSPGLDGIELLQRDGHRASHGQSVADSASVNREMLR